MPVIRNPFRKNAQVSNSPSETVADGPRSASPALSSSNGTLPVSDSNLLPSDDLERSHLSASAISISKENEGYQLSVVNDSGVYLPPSPPDKKSFWKRSGRSTSKDCPPLSPDEPFTISRESFDSYRRSFDISARSPVIETTSGRMSLDSRPLTSRMSLDSRPSRMSLDYAREPRMSLDYRLPPTVKDVEEPIEDGFEDVKLNDDSTRPKKRSIFSRFGGDHSSSSGETNSKTSSGLFGRKDHPQDTASTSELKRIAEVGLNE